MNPILLHIGLTKTGTSSLQSFLDAHPDALEDAGFVYPKAGRGRRGRKAHHNIYYETRVGGAGNDTFDSTLGGWADVLREVDEVGSRTGIISSEALQYSTAEQVSGIGEVLDGRDVTIVAYLRRHDRWLESAWNQRARFGRVSLSFDEFFQRDGRVLGDYASTLAPWIDAFGDDHVDVRIYDAIADVPGIVRDFTSAHLDGFDRAVSSDTTLRRNSKVGLKHLVAVATVTRVCRETLGDEFTLSARSANRISSFFRDRRDRHDFSVLSFDDATEIVRYFHESSERLAQASTSYRSSGRFLAPQPADFQNHVDLSSADALGNEPFDDEERQFVNRMATEIIKATQRSTEAVR